MKTVACSCLATIVSLAYAQSAAAQPIVLVTESVGGKVVPVRNAKVVVFVYMSKRLLSRQEAKKPTDHNGKTRLSQAIADDTTVLVMVYPQDKREVDNNARKVKVDKGMISVTVTFKRPLPGK